MSIFERIEALHFPRGHYVVVGSGILAARGIREAADLDIVVSPELFEQCRLSGWELKPWTKIGMDGKPWLKGEKADLMIEMLYKGESLDVPKLLAEADVISDIPFLNLRRLIALKREYGRQKDFDDIILIERYLARNT